MKKLMLTLLLVVGTMSLAFALPLKAYKGKTPIKPGEKFGVAVWHDAAGFHLCSTTKGKLHVFTGKIKATKALGEFSEVKLEKGDWVKRMGPKKIKFHFTTKGHTDCVQFRMKGDATITLMADGKKLPVKHIFVGEKMVHPINNPFIINRLAK